MMLAFKLLITFRVLFYIIIVKWRSPSHQFIKF